MAVCWQCRGVEVQVGNAPLSARGWVGEGGGSLCSHRYRFGQLALGVPAQSGAKEVPETTAQLVLLPSADGSRVNVVLKATMAPLPSTTLSSGAEASLRVMDHPPLGSWASQHGSTARPAGWVVGRAPRGGSSQEVSCRGQCVQLCAQGQRLCMAPCIFASSLGPGCATEATVSAAVVMPATCFAS